MRQTDTSDYKTGDKVNTLRRGYGVVLEISGTRYVKVLTDDAYHISDITVCIPSHGELEKI